MVIGDLVYRITGDTSSFNSSMNKAESSFSKFGKYLGAFLAGGAVLDIGKQMVKIASDAQETGQKFGVVFAGMTAEANKAAAEFAKGYNVSNMAAKEMLSNTGNILQAVGYTTEASLDMSLQLNQLASDLVSFTNYQGGAAEAGKILTKALLGEMDALGALGLKVRAEDLKAYIEAQGQSYESATLQTKAQATLALVMKQSQNAIGDTARSTGSYAYNLRAAENAATDMAEVFGKELLPILTEALINFKMVSGYILEARAAFDSLSPDITRTAKQLYELLNPLKLTWNMLKAIKDVGQTSQLWYEGKITAKQALITGYDLSEKSKIPAAAGGGGMVRKPDLPSTGSAAKPVKEQAAEDAEAVNQFAGEVLSLNNLWRQAQYEANIAFEEMTPKDKLTAIVDQVGKIQAAFSDMFGAIGDLSKAYYENELAQLEDQRNAALEAAGVAEDTAVEKAQAEYDAAVAGGDAIVIKEKENALTKAKINEDYDKKKAKLEYQGALRAWQFQLAGAIAAAPLTIMQAYLTGWGAGWPAGVILAPALAGIAAATAGIQVAAVAAGKPSAPKFADGGVVPGSLTVGDRVPIQANSGEMVLNDDQQAKLFNIANGSGGSGITQIYLNLEGYATKIYEGLLPASKNGIATLHFNAVVSR